MSEPEIREPTDALVRPLAVAVCDLDVALFHGDAPPLGEYPLGHEFVAEVVSVGSQVQEFQPGERVLVPFQISCGTCAACAAARTANCLSVPPSSAYGFGTLGGMEWGGALADVVRVPFADHMLITLPAGIRPEQAAAVADNIADGWRCVAPGLAARPGGSVLVVGGMARSIGLWAAEMAGVLGAETVTYVDPDPDGCRWAAQAGADVVEGSYPTKLKSHAITVDASGRPEGLLCALRSAGRDGLCTSASILWEDVAIPIAQMYAKGVTFVTGRVHSRATAPHVLDLVSQGRIDPLRFATVVGTDEIIEALSRRPAKIVAVGS